MVQTCDLYKTEYDPDQTVTIVFKSKDKRKGQSYDLCPEAAEALQQALVSRVPHRITELSPIGDTPECRLSVTTVPSHPEMDVFQVQTEKALDDDAFITMKLAERGLEPKSSEECLHLNKTPPRQRTVNGENGFWHICKDCKALIKPTTAKSRKEYHEERSVD
jgi:hypothetical protein